MSVMDARRKGQGEKVNLLKKYLAVSEESGSPNLPGCVPRGATRAEVERNIGRTVSGLRNELRADGELVPEPRSYSAYLACRAGAEHKNARHSPGVLFTNFHFRFSNFGSFYR